MILRRSFLIVYTSLLLLVFGTQIGKLQASEQRKKQRLVLIAGPHKTGSSSIQNNMYTWTTVPNANNTLLLPQWAWPHPDQIFDGCDEKVQKYMHAKIFYPFGEALHSCRISKSRKIYDLYSCEELLEVYRSEFQRKWDEGYNLVIGTESFDLIGGMPYMGDVIYMDDVMKYLPSQVSKEDVTIVVKYRSPRSKHLVSWYHECCRKDKTFLEFLNKEMEKYPDRGSRIIDSLYLVNKLANEGYNVVLFDMSGVADQGYDISNVIACDVLDANCSAEKEIVGQLEPPTITNVKKAKHFGDFKEEDMKKIESIIRRRDCKFVGLEDHSKVTVMYAKDFKSTMAWCESHLGVALSRGEMNMAIKTLLRDINTDFSE